MGMVCRYFGKPQYEPPVLIPLYSPHPHSGLSHVNGFGQKDFSKQDISRGLISACTQRCVPREHRYHAVRRPRPTRGHVEENQGFWETAPAEHPGNCQYQLLVMRVIILDIRAQLSTSMTAALADIL